MRAIVFSARSKLKAERLYSPPYSDLRDRHATLAMTYFLLSLRRSKATVAIPAIKVGAAVYNRPYSPNGVAGGEV